WARGFRTRRRTIGLARRPRTFCRRAAGARCRERKNAAQYQTIRTARGLGSKRQRLAKSPAMRAALTRRSRDARRISFVVPSELLGRDRFGRQQGTMKVLFATPEVS